jgi:hypothetical protein
MLAAPPARADPGPMRAAPSPRRRAALSLGAQAGGIAALALAAAACTDLFHSTDWTSFCEAQPNALQCVASPVSSGATGGGGGSGGSGGAGTTTGTGGNGVGSAGGSGGGDPTPPCSVAFGDIAAQHVASMSTDASGNTLIAGSYAGVLDFGNDEPFTAVGATDIFAAKLDVACAPVWSRSFGATLDDQALSVAVDSQGDLVIGGNFSGPLDFGLGLVPHAGALDIFVLKLDGATGATTWASAFGSVDNDNARAVAVDAQDNVLVTGDFTNSVSFGGPSLVSAGNFDVFAVKFDPGGGYLWSLQAGTLQNQRGRSITADPMGNVIVSGEFQTAINFGLGSKPSAGANDIFVVKFDPDGAVIWDRTFGDEVGQSANNIAAGPDGSVVLSSIFEGTVDFGGGVPLVSAGGSNAYVAKLDANGEHVWSKSFGSASGSQSLSVAVGATGDVTISGNFSGTIDFGGGLWTSAGATDGYVAWFTPAGVYRDAVQFGDAVGQTANDARVDALGNVVVVGDFDGSIDLGGSLQTSAGVNDVVVARLAPP